MAICARPTAPTSPETSSVLLPHLQESDQQL
eukprot:COSAG06_NODE_32531_length_504_cov_1.116049_1_plen_30_part_01